jgi:ABC-type multidrug transport system fused ATPase/permease subunit
MLTVSQSHRGIWSFTQGYRWKLLLSGVLVLIGTTLSLVYPVVIAKVLDASMSKLKDGELTFCAIALLIVFLLRVLIEYTGSYLLDTRRNRFAGSLTLGMNGKSVSHAAQNTSAPTTRRTSRRPNAG